MTFNRRTRGIREFKTKHIIANTKSDIFNLINQERPNSNLPYVSSLKWKRKKYPWNIYGGPNYGSNITHISYNFRSSIEKIVTNKSVILFIQRMFWTKYIGPTLLKLLCDDFDSWKKYYTDLRTQVNDLIDSDGNKIFIDLSI